MIQRTPLGWVGIVRLGLVQSALGALVMPSTSLLNRVMIVEYALPAAVPAGLVAWHYAVQLSRPLWGHGSDIGQRRTPWILGGIAVLALGSMLAAAATVLMHSSPVMGGSLAVIGFTLIGGGVGAAGTSLLALLATRVAPARRAAAASTTWIMMIIGIVVTAAVAGALIDPFSPMRLLAVTTGVALCASVLASFAVWGVEGDVHVLAAAPTSIRRSLRFADALAELYRDDAARYFTIFVFVSMLAYSMQDLILEPFAGIMFGYSPGQSMQLSGLQHMGVLAGMIVVGVGGSIVGNGRPAALKIWTVAGCLGSAGALACLSVAARAAPGWPFAANVVALGLFNGVFAVAAIGSMMALAGAGDGPSDDHRSGFRMGVWGASQAIAFGVGGLSGALGVDVLRSDALSAGTAFGAVFGIESLLFVAAAGIAAMVVGGTDTVGHREALA